MLEITVGAGSVSIRHRDRTRIQRLDAPLPSYRASALERSDAQHCGYEEQLGQQLGQALGLTQLEPTVFVQGDAWSAPWELLAVPGHPPGESTGSVVFRRVAGQFRPRLGVRWRVSALCPTPDDPVCRDVLQQLDLQVHDELPQVEEGLLDLVFLVAHGSIEGERAVLHGEAQHDASTWAHVLGDALRDRAVVVLAACSSGAAPNPLGGAAQRLASAGAGVVLAPHEPVGPQVLAVLGGALRTALVGGSSVREAVREARRAVRARASGFSAERWHRFLALATDPEAVRLRSLPVDWPADAPVPSVEASAWLAEAVRVAHADEVGFLGLEHLLTALMKVPGRTDVLVALTKRRLATLEPSLPALRAGTLVRNPSEAGPMLRPTPRLRRALGRLQDGYGVAHLLGELYESDSGLGLLCGDIRRGAEAGGESTWGGSSLAGSLEPRTEACVVWGPEDGQRFRLAPGGCVGRWSGSGAAEQALFGTSTDVDRALSRRALQRTETGWRVLRRVHVRRGGQWHRAEVGEEIEDERLVQLTGSTWLWTGS